LAIEVKYADAPRLTPSMASAIHDLELKHLWVVYPGERSYPLSDKITVLPLTELDATLQREDRDASADLT